MPFNLSIRAEHSLSLLYYFRTIICLIVIMADSELFISEREAVL